MNVGTYTTFKTKKALREAVAKTPVACFPGSPLAPFTDGRHVCVGPNIERDRRWYAEVEVRDERIVKVIA